ncbi:hypothetical protein [Desulfoluna sp.]|uniref:hypothetical protein n=1 Tax=Desulfoluna sp. TaxID=2045199 RepID=UPI002616141A|nr:hypothetical protein [Desulfoluna sp.]
MFKKVFAAMLAGLFIAAPAFAEVKMNGSFFIKGNYVDTGKDVSTYESDFEVKTQFIVDENTSATIVVEAFDNNWDKGVGTDSVPVKVLVDSDDDGAFDTTKEGSAVSGEAQNHLQVTTAKMDHNFGNGFAFSGGIDGNGNSFGTAFNDDADKEYFLQGTMDLPFGSVTAKTQKIDETDAVDKDTDAYQLALTLKAGGFEITPAFYYLDKQLADKTNTKMMVYTTGKIANVDLTAEVVYEDDEARDAKTYGLYVQADTTVAALGVTVAGIYSSEDDNKAFKTGDELAIMDIATDNVEIDGANLFKVGVSKSLTEKISVDGAVAAILDNLDDNAAGNNQDGYEADLNAYFKASDAVTLSCGIATLDLDYMKDARIDGYAKINVAF